MHITQAPPTSAPVTRRTSAALLATPAVASLVVPVPRADDPQPGERGHLQHLLVSTIRAKHYSRKCHHHVETH